jgi:hypothetical protein
MLPCHSDRRRRRLCLMLHLRIKSLTSSQKLNRSLIQQELPQQQLQNQHQHQQQQQQQHHHHQQQT